MTFKQFLARLSNDEKARLFHSVTFLLECVGSADGKFDLREQYASVKSAALFEKLDEAFYEYFDTNEDVYNEYSELIHKDIQKLGLERVLKIELLNLSKIVDRMPLQMKEIYLDALKESVLKVASASGSFLGMGEAINEKEKAIIEEIEEKLNIKILE